MPIVEIHTYIKSDIKTCFDLARDIDFHQESLEYSNERTVLGKTSGLIELGEFVTCEAKHFGVTQRLTSKITEFDSLSYFVDEMVSGAFKYFRHEHIFSEKSKITLMIDKLYFESPYGIIGKFVNKLFLTRYMENLLKKRNLSLKQKTEKV